MSPARPLVQPPTPFFDREDELRRIAVLLNERVRLVTLVGPAGVGKTRLALAAAQHVAGDFPDGVLSVDLAPVRDPQGVLPAIARATGLGDLGTEVVLARFQTFLGEGRVLILLDNFEQVLPAAADIAALLAGSPGLHLLVTSRAPLHLRWEHTLRVAPLPVPDAHAVLPIETLRTIPSVALFTERARAQRADFIPTDRDAPSLATLVWQLDGLPLAIELAAAQMDALPLATITRHLAQRIAMLRWDAPDMPDRHHSLHAAMEWGYELLTASEQRLFRYLGVFVGRVSPAAIAAVIGEPDEDRALIGMVALAEKSLVLPGRAEDDAEPAFGLLETVRQYAREQLIAQDEMESASRAHAMYFVSLAERANSELRRREQTHWYARLEREHDNLRAALRWLLDHGGEEQALRLVGALGRFWLWRGYYTEGVRWPGEALRAAPDAAPALRIRPLLGASLLLLLQGDAARAGPFLEEALALARQQEDRAAQAEALAYLGARAARTGVPDEARRLLREGLRLAEDLHDDYQPALILCVHANVEAAAGNYREAASQFAAAVTRYLAVGALDDARVTRFFHAVALVRLGEERRAAAIVREAIERSTLVGARWEIARAVEATLLLVGEAIASDPGVRLLGALEALDEVTGRTPGIMPIITGVPMPDVRVRIKREGLEAAYRAGRSLPIAEIASLALSVLDTFEHHQPGVAVTEGPPPDAARSPVPRELPPRETSRQENPLSEREREVLRLVAEGMTSRAVGERLFIAPSTVNYHLTAIFNKLGVDTRAQAVAIALQRDLL
jgi:predicted ATPase/DNA-binding CsgD family transcriptional regulator